MTSMPAREDGDERAYEQRHRAETSFDTLVDELMHLHGYDKDEAELLATAALAGVPIAALRRAVEDQG
jgi:hypothetical protein